MNIILLGQSGFPYGMATIQKMKLIAEGLVHHGNHVTFFNRLPVFPEKAPYTALNASGNIQGVDYIYTSGSPIRPERFLKRNIIRLLSFYKELVHLTALNRRFKTDVAILYETKFIYLLWYFLISRILGFRIYLHYVEFRSKVPGRPLTEKINHQLFDRYAFRFLDGILPISNLLEKHVLGITPSLPSFKIPTLVDFSLFDPVEKGNGHYFLFCGSADYSEIILFIIRCFEMVVHPEFRLKLITNGSKEGLNTVRTAVAASPKGGLIDVLTNIPYPELIENYCNATSLLIPLRNTLQDEARFPHKIGEYTASSKPIITTDSGEIRYYFRHGENALIAEHMEEKRYSDLMNDVISNNGRAVTIGTQGYLTGKNFFDHIRVTGDLHNFLLQETNT
jgi:glycosyltransferase involved in cell wall biosynthesis